VKNRLGELVCEPSRGVPAIQEPVRDTLRRAAQHPAGALKALIMGADKVLPVVAEDLVERIISKDAGTVSHGADQGKTGAGVCARIIGAGSYLKLYQ